MIITTMAYSNHDSCDVSADLGVVVDDNKRQYKTYITLHSVCQWRSDEREGEGRWRGRLRGR